MHWQKGCRKSSSIVEGLVFRASLFFSWQCLKYDTFSSDIESNLDGNESSASIEETAQEKRLRLAKEYIRKLEEEGIIVLWNLDNIFVLRRC